MHAVFRNIFFIEPLLLELENEYNLNVIKEIATTDSFNSMSKDVRKCEIDETQDECATRKFIDDLRHSCKCLPLNLRLSNKVK